MNLATRKSKRNKCWAFALVLERKLMKKIVEKLKQQHFLRAFIGFYDKSEIGITSIAVAYYFLI